MSLVKVSTQLLNSHLPLWALTLLCFYHSISFPLDFYFGSERWRRKTAAFVVTSQMCGDDNSNLSDLIQVLIYIFKERGGRKREWKRRKIFLVSQSFWLTRHNSHVITVNHHKCFSGHFEDGLEWSLPPWYSQPCISLPLSISLLSNRIWQCWRKAISMFGQKDCDTYLISGLPLAGFDEASQQVGETDMVRNWWWPLTNNRKEIEPSVQKWLEFCQQPYKWAGKHILP